jgi:hypothetical protein
MPEAPEERTPGDAGAGRLLNGVGVAMRPRALTPQWWTNPPLVLRWRPGGHAELGKRLQRGRTRHAVQAYGGERWGRAWALAGGA